MPELPWRVNATRCSIFGTAMYHQNQRRKCHVCESRLHGKKRQSNLMRTSEKPLESMRKRKRTPGSPRYHPKGWERVRAPHWQTRVAALRLYSFLAEHIDPSCGAVVADQQFLADKMGVNRSTIIRWLNYLESKNALVRIPVAGKVCAYALDPHEVW